MGITQMNGVFWQLVGAYHKTYCLSAGSLPSGALYDGKLSCLTACRASQVHLLAPWEQSIGLEAVG